MEIVGTRDRQVATRVDELRGRAPGHALHQRSGVRGVRGGRSVAALWVLLRYLNST